MLDEGEWRPTAQALDPGTLGFHLSALYSPVGWMSWAMIAQMWELASTDEAKRSFKNAVLGETWVETGEAPDWQRLYERREDWQIGTVPNGGLFLTAGADVQKDRIEISVWAWGRGLESWLVDHLVIEGGPEHAGTWAQVSEFLSRTWPHSDGVRLGLAKLAVDTGYQAPAGRSCDGERCRLNVSLYPTFAVFSRTTATKVLFVAQSFLAQWAS
jgi:phage terminase large subunit GpA-like protein